MTSQREAVQQQDIFQKSPVRESRTPGSVGMKVSDG